MKIKYPRTFHLPLSESKTDDDKSHNDYLIFQGNEVVISLKMDGEATTMYSDYIHARSVNSNNHPSRNWIKGFHGNIKHNIPVGWRICGEGLYAKHSIFYDNLDSYFYCYNIWNEENICLSYDDTLEWCNLLEIIHVPIVYKGLFDLEIVTNIYKNLDKNKNEGLVIRNSKSFHFNDFKNNIGKIVRPSHVQTDEHWMFSEIIPNKLKSYE